MDGWEEGGEEGGREKVGCKCASRMICSPSVRLGLALEAEHPKILNGEEQGPVAAYPQETLLLRTGGLKLLSDPGKRAGPPAGPVHQEDSPDPLMEALGPTLSARPSEALQ